MLGQPLSPRGSTAPAEDPYRDLPYEGRQQGGYAAPRARDPYYAEDDPAERMPLVSRLWALSAADEDCTDTLILKDGGALLQIYWLGREAWNSTRGSARIDIVRPTSSRSQGRSGFLGLPRIRPDQLFRPATLPEYAGPLPFGSTPAALFYPW